MPTTSISGVPLDWSIFKFGRLSRRVLFIGGALTMLQGILWYFLPLYFDSVLDNMMLVGIVISAFSAGSLLVSLPAGDVADRVGNKFTFVFGLVGFIVSMFFLFIGNFLYFALFMFCFGAFTTISDIPIDAYLLGHSTKKNVPGVMSVSDMLSNLGWGFGPIIAGALLLYFDAPLFIGVLILSLVAVSTFSLSGFPGEFGMKFSNLRKSEQVLAKDGIYVGECRRLFKLGWPLLAIVLFSFTFGFWEYAVWTFEPVWANAAGSGLLLGAVILMLDSAPYIPFMFLAGVMTNKLGLRKMFLIGTFFTVLGQSLFLVNQSLLTLALTLGLTPFGVSFLATAMSTYIRRNVKKGIYGEVDGIDRMLYEIGGIVGPLAVGALAITAGMTSFVYVSFTLFLASSAVLLAVFGRK